jgi:hypothetical protein
MGRTKRDRNHSPSKNNIIKDSEGNEENGYLIPVSNKTKMNDSKEPKDVTKTPPKKKSCKYSLRISWR